MTDKTVHLLRMQVEGMSNPAIDARYQSILGEIENHERSIAKCREALELITKEVERRFQKP